MAKQSSVNLDITNNADGFDISGGTTPRKLGITGGDVTIAGSGSATVTFPTTSTTIAGLGIAQSFTALQTFSAGISASGATFTGLISGATATFSKDITVNSMTVGLGKSPDTTNVAIGSGALASNTSDFVDFGISNVAVGGYALTANTTGSYNTAIGGQALTTNTTGSSNTALGGGALASNTSGENNIAIGYNALVNSSTASSNIAIGTLALAYGSLGSFNIGIGFETLGAAGNTGNSNVAVGYQSLKTNTTGSNNTGIGTSALLPLTTGSQMTALGYNAGRYRGTATATNTTGTGGIYIGFQARASAAAQTNEIVIGVNALGLGSNTAVIGATLQSAATIYGVLNLPSGLSASGATFGGTVNLQDNTLSRVEFLDYFERFVDLGDFASKGSPIPIDLSTGQVFRTKYTLAGTGLSVTNVPDNGNANAVGFSLLFVGDGTARTMTWNIGNTAASWAGGTAPTYTSTLNKIDVYSFLSRDGGSTWLGFVGGQNF
jgi:hypothetical protein